MTRYILQIDGEFVTLNGTLYQYDESELIAVLNNRIKLGVFDVVVIFKFDGIQNSGRVK